ncbi:MAG: polyketide synthase dehydratase domain-containing protein [Ardenticatenales bacterium]|nr:polyketide synthase dehydratase domain-containing protein [Ardenticatenales bacterium]
MSCLLPGASSLSRYWENILNKVDAITDPPPEAWHSDIFYDRDSSANDRVYCKKGGYLGPIAYFNPLQHGVMPISAEGGEPDQWLALEVATRALADAGYLDVKETRERTAVIIGKGTYLNRGNLSMIQHGLVVDQTLSILRELYPEEAESRWTQVRDELKAQLPPFTTETATALVPNIIAGRIANKLDLMGPSYTVDAACASSLLAVEQAIQGLRSGAYDMALVGGAQVTTPIPVLTLFCQLEALSHNERIRPFDQKADGTILSEGLGMVVLKRLDAAERDGDRIYAVIKGTGVASDGRALGVLAPRLEGEVLALQRAYADADLEPQSIGLVEAHGTATVVGDATEIEALSTVLTQGDPQRQRVALGSVKSMIGHTMPAAGIAGLIKCALALYHRVLPPTLNVETPNDALQADDSPLYLNTESRPWLHSRPLPRRAGINSFGFGGINAHAILEEYPAANESALPSQHLSWECELIVLQAETRQALIDRARSLHDFLAAEPEVALKDVAYTLNLHRAALDQRDGLRLALVASSLDDLHSKLAWALPRLSDENRTKIQGRQGIYFAETPIGRQGKLAFIFPGEGAQYVNMFADLALHFPVVRRAFEEMDRLFADHDRGYQLSDVIFPIPTAAAEADAEARLWQMDVAVEALTTANHAIFLLLGSLGLQPDALLGHSTGEYSAMRAAGMLDVAPQQFADRVKRLNRLYEQVHKAGGIPKAMLVAVAAERQRTEALVAGLPSVSVAMDNCPHQVVLAVAEAQLDQLRATLQDNNLIYEVLRFDRAYHTPLFGPYAEVLRDVLQGWIVAPPEQPLYSCTTVGLFPDDLARCREIAHEHWIAPVEFRRTIEKMHDDGVRLFVEVGPRGNMSAFIGDVLRGREQMIIPSNLHHRSGLVQLHHLLAMLAAQAVPLSLDALYSRRAPRIVDFTSPANPYGDNKKQMGTMKLATGWPPIELSEDTIMSLRASANPHPPHDNGWSGSAPSANDPAPTFSATTAAPSPVVAAPAPVVAAPAAYEFAPYPASDERTEVMLAYLQTMESFLQVQERVMQGYLGGAAPDVVEGRRRMTLPAPRQPVAVPPTPRAVSAVPVAPPVAVPSAPPPAVAPAAPPPAPVSATPPSVPAPPVVAPPPSNGAAHDHAPASGFQMEAATVQSILVTLISERTGYPPEMLEPTLDLEADLGIDSIKRVEIIGTFQQQSGVELGAQVEELAARKTLAEMVDFLTAIGDDPPPNGSGNKKPLEASDRPFEWDLLATAPSGEIVVGCTLTLADLPFLRDHTLGRDVSRQDATLTALPVLPLTMSMELLAQAAAHVAPGQVVVEMKEIRASKWIAFEDEPLRMVATVSPPQAGWVTVTLAHDATPQQPVVRGEIRFAAHYPPAPAASPWAPLAPSTWRAEALYTEGIFHGPRFQGIVTVDGFDPSGRTAATLRALPREALFAQSERPALLTDPVLLDQPGQVVAFWIWEQFDRGHLIFPYRLAGLKLYGPPPRAGERFDCRGWVTDLDEVRMASDLEVVDGRGRVWARLDGWEDRRFHFSEPVARYMLDRRATDLSQPWPALLGQRSNAAGLVARSLALSDLPEGFLTGHGGHWQRVLAHIVLSERERAQWRAQRGPERRRVEWLLGRVVAKESVRALLAAESALSPALADLEILSDGAGRPTVEAKGLPFAVRLSIAHRSGRAVALAGRGDRYAGVGVDLESSEPMTEATSSVAFGPQERALIEGLPADSNWAMRGWCAKEAVGKAWGIGLGGAPRRWQLASASDDGQFAVIPSAALATEQAVGRATAQTMQNHGWVAALSVVPHREAAQPTTE